jgi:hypothetical protein
VNLSTNTTIVLPEWNRTALGTPIALHACRPLHELLDQRPIVVVGGVHGDEPEGVRLAQDTLAWLNQSAFQVRAPWIVVPCLNADGFARNSRVNSRGVDLNRNYPSRDWSNRCDKERYFPGLFPGSESEVQGMVALLQAFRPRLVIHCHSWQPCVVATGANAQTDAERLGRSSGYRVVEEIGYPTPGSLSRYGWHDNQIPIICIEEQELLADLNSIWPRFEAGMREIFSDASLRGAV